MQTIDLTDRYDDDRYRRTPRERWTLDRAKHPVRAVVLHHTAGWYGPALGEGASERQERDQIDALAADHRERFGIGPGYHYLAFPSGRLYAVGKWGTHRAHTKGRDPDRRDRWNVQAIGLCAFGNFEVETPSRGLLAALRAGIREVRRLADAEVAVFPHGGAPTVDASGASLPQTTACPGAALNALLAEIGRAHV